MESALNGTTRVLLLTLPLPKRVVSSVMMTGLAIGLVGRLFGTTNRPAEQPGLEIANARPHHPRQWSQPDWWCARLVW